MSRIIIQALLAVVLLFNGPAGSIAVASPVSEPASSDMHAHCEQMLAQETAATPASADQYGGDHKGHSSDACCNAGSCHCGSISLSARPVVGVSQVLLLVSCAGSSHSPAPLSPTPSRHFRPPIL
jgi:hypothetical protein